jgi:hypothetical protein
MFKSLKFVLTVSKCRKIYENPIKLYKLILVRELSG